MIPPRLMTVSDKTAEAQKDRHGPRKFFSFAVVHLRIGESLFLRKLVLGIRAQASGKNLTRPPLPTAPQPSCSPRFMPNQGHETRCAMTRRDVGMLCNFTTPTALREIAQPYRFWGLLGFPPRSERSHILEHILTPRFWKLPNESSLVKTKFFEQIF